jgi:hypothetical protein
MRRKWKRGVETAFADLTAGRADNPREWVELEARRQVVEGDSGTQNPFVVADFN